MVKVWRNLKNNGLLRQKNTKGVRKGARMPEDGED